MRDIELNSSFVQKVQKLNDKRNIPYTVMQLAKALDELPEDIAEDVLYHSLTTYSLGGKQLDQEELVLSIFELRRIRAEKDDGFMLLPTEKWNYLESTPEYKRVAKIVKCSLERGLILHTISGYLKDHDADRVDKTICGLLTFKKNVETILKPEGKQVSIEESEAISRMFYSHLIHVCSSYVMRTDYISSFSLSTPLYGEFEIAFADLFIKMANEPLTYI